MLEPLLSRLGLDSSEIKTYTTLLETGPTTAGVLAKSSGIVRVTQYVLLERLIEKGFVLQSFKNGIKLFTALHPEKIASMYEDKMKLVENDYKEYKKLLPELKSKNPNTLLIPKFQIFEGVEGLKNVLKDMLLYKNMETQAYWPIKKMVDILSPDFFRHHNKERIQNNLYTRAIWPKSQVVDIKTHPYLGVGEKFQREIRIAPPEIHFTMGYWIYGNKVAFLSSRKESFGYIIESSELAETLLSQFEVMWNISKPFKPQPQYTDSFLKTV